MDGVLLIDKPHGWTSFDVVNKVRRVVEQSGQNHTGKKRFPVGHTGTLDPLATGLLVLLVGGATKQAPGLTKLDKSYEVTMRLGQTSTTGDEEGDKTEVSDMQPSQAAIEAALDRFRGVIEQTPPAYSAIKINGQRAYKLARAGKPVQIKPRSVTVHRLVLKGYAYPEVYVTATVSSGTYIRSLVADIGDALGTGAFMSSLRRLTVGGFSLSDALTMEGLKPEDIRLNIRPLESSDQT